MNWIQRIAKSFRNIFRKNANDTVELRELYKFLNLDANTSKDALSESTYFACMKLLCESIGKLPIRLLRQNDKNGVEVMRRHPLFHIICERPNPYMTASTFWSTVEFNRNHYGNAYAWIQGAGKDMKLWILPSEQVQIYWDNAKIMADQPDIYYVYSGTDGKMYKFSSEEILHFKTSNTLDGLVGVSVQEQLRMTIQGGVESQAMLNKMYKSGFTAKTVLNYTGNLSDANVQALVDMVESYGKGELSNDAVTNTIPMPLGFSLTPLNIKLADNQFIEVKQYTSLQIASAFGIKPYQIGDYTKSSYASAEAQQLSFYVDTLLYNIKQYEEELSYKLLSQYECRNGYFFKFNVAVVLRADLATQIETLSKGVSNFIYTPNEARSLLDLEAKEGGDQLLGNGASIPITLIGTQYNDNLGKEENEDEPKDLQQDGRT